jgi:hypothetical protein
LCLHWKWFDCKPVVRVFRSGRVSSGRIGRVAVAGSIGIHLSIAAIFAQQGVASAGKLLTREANIEPVLNAGEQPPVRWQTLGGQVIIRLCPTCRGSNLRRSRAIIQQALRLAPGTQPILLGPSDYRSRE